MKKHQEIVNLLSKGLPQASKRFIEQNRKLICENVDIKIEKQKHQSTIKVLQNQLHQYEHLDEILNEVKNTFEQS